MPASRSPSFELRPGPVTDPLARVSAALSSRYAIERELGRGGMATVYLAADLKHHRQVAVKVLRPELSSALGGGRFLREIEIAASLAHPHILPVFDSGEADGLLYYVMPYVVGESLRARLARDGRLPVEDAVRVAWEVANALGYAHAQGVIHRDIKPENILIQAGHAVVADFGIAYAVSTAADLDDDVTVTGLALGTPLYMSPEQAAARGPVDGRSDLYALGCVLYEMLAGSPPFTGPNAHSVAAQHAYDLPEPLRSRRPEAPEELADVVARTLAKLPEGRFATGDELAAALRRFAAATTPLPGTTGSVKHPRLGGRRAVAAWAAMGTLVAAGTVATKDYHPLPAGDRLDASTYMVASFRHRGPALRALGADACESLMHESLSRWPGLQVVDPLWVEDQRARRHGSERLDDDLAVARLRRAGRVVSGEVWLLGDSVRVRAVLYDAGRPDHPIREQSINVASDLSDAQAKFDALADSLVTGGARVGTPAPRGVGRVMLPAWEAFQDGYSAAQRWELDSAKTKLQAAVRLDPGFAMAQLWLAQVMQWAGDPTSEWSRHASASLAGAAALPPRERGVAEAMTQLAHGDYPRACETYRAVLVRDSLDFGAWFGLGECQGQDPVVEPDPSSSSGWRFRGSYAAAIRAYRRALETVPSVHLAFRGAAVLRLSDLLYTEPYHLRQGVALRPDTVRFGAFPALDHDTLAFHPRPLPEVVSSSSATPATLQDAVEYNRRVLRGVAATWVRSYPRSADAHEVLARALESLQQLGGRGTGDTSALDELRRARALSTDAAQSLRLAASEVRVLLKSSEMSRARQLADSLLRAHPAPDLDDARQLRGLAALTGRVHLTAALLQRAAPEFSFLTPEWRPIEAPRPLTEAGLALLAYASLGAPIDSIEALNRRVEHLVRSYFAPARRTETRQGILDAPGELAFPEVGSGPTHRAAAPYRPVLEMQWLLARNETRLVRRRLAALDRSRGPQIPGDIAFDGTYLEARLLLAVGDTVAAVEALDLSLDALSVLGPDLLDQIPQVATLVRGMALRAELAAARGEPALARRWAAAVLELWARADPALGAVRAAMQQIVDAGR